MRPGWRPCSVQPGRLLYLDPGLGAPRKEAVPAVPGRPAAAKGRCQPLRMAKSRAGNAPRLEALFGPTGEVALFRSWLGCSSEGAGGHLPGQACGSKIIGANLPEWRKLRGTLISGAQSCAEP